MHEEKKDPEEMRRPPKIRENEKINESGHAKRIRVTAHYMEKDSIEQVNDREGVFCGDITEKEVEKDGGQKQATKVKQGKGCFLFNSGDFYNGDWADNKMHGKGTYYCDKENIFYSGEFKENERTGRGVYYYSDSQNFFLGEVVKGEYQGKGLFYNRETDSWELNNYAKNKVTEAIKTGDGRPYTLEIAKGEVDDINFQEIYIRPKDFFFDHYEGDMVNCKREGNGVLFNRDGSRYEGTWKKNKPNGLGAFVYAD